MTVNPKTAIKTIGFIAAIVGGAATMAVDSIEYKDYIKDERSKPKVLVKTSEVSTEG